MSAAGPAPGGWELKVCGAVSTRELDALAEAGATLAGVWWGVPGSPRDLDVQRVATLAAHARDTGGPGLCLVTLCPDPDAVAGVVRSSGVRDVQLHAFQLPAVVRRLRHLLPAGTRLWKAAHVDAGRCLEEPFLGAYARAGADGFVLDAVSGGRVGSTGTALEPAVVRGFAALAPRPFLLAGGLDAHPSAQQLALRELPGLTGIDLDGAARDAGGPICARRVRAVARAWPGTAATTPAAAAAVAGAVAV
ncbi:phosphoribosylanthranilate isomerase [Kineococcus sp. SYSU DK018]|uniref:phosphoribosylanthranilate isomerase n=1 Tax=Kineococcus sp. SYSU DK018 TaxID=3383139 RepID=UPI003D7C5480